MDSPINPSQVVTEAEETRVITIYLLTRGDMRWVVTEKDNPHKSVPPYTGAFGGDTKRAVLIRSLLTNDNKINSRPDTHRFPLRELINRLGKSQSTPFF